jgi:hypothetical protein
MPAPQHLSGCCNSLCSRLDTNRASSRILSYLVIVLSWIRTTLPRRRLSIRACPQQAKEMAGVVDTFMKIIIVRPYGSSEIAREPFQLVCLLKKFHFSVLFS